MSKRGYSNSSVLTGKTEVLRQNRNEQNIENQNRNLTTVEKPETSKGNVS